MRFSFPTTCNSVRLNFESCSHKSLHFRTCKVYRYNIILSMDKIIRLSHFGEYYILCCRAAISQSRRNTTCFLRAPDTRGHIYTRFHLYSSSNDSTMLSLKIILIMYNIAFAPSRKKD